MRPLAKSRKCQSISLDARVSYDDQTKSHWFTQRIFRFLASGPSTFEFRVSRQPEDRLTYCSRRCPQLRSFATSTLTFIFDKALDVFVLDRYGIQSRWTWGVQRGSRLPTPRHLSGSSAFWIKASLLTFFRLLFLRDAFDFSLEVAFKLMILSHAKCGELLLGQPFSDLGGNRAGIAKHLVLVEL